MKNDKKLKTQLILSENRQKYLSILKFTSNNHRFVCMFSCTHFKKNVLLQNKKTFKEFQMYEQRTNTTYTG